MTKIPFYFSRMQHGKIYLAESLQSQNKLCSMKMLQRIAKKVLQENQAC